MELYKNLTENEIINRCAAGETEMFDILVKKLGKKVWAFILKDVKDEGEADELYQTCLIKAYECICNGRYKNNGKFNSWIMTVAHNVVMDYFRANKSKNNRIEDCGIKNIESFGDDEENNNGTKENYGIIAEEDDTPLSIIRDRIPEYIDELNEKEKEVLKMHYYKNMSFKEISEITRTSINTVLGISHNAKRKMKERMQPELNNLLQA